MRIGITDPLVLLAGVGLDQTRGRSLHRAAEPMEEFAHMARMVTDAEFLLEDLSQDGRSPNARVQTMSYRSAFHNIMEQLLLFLREFAGASAPMSFLDPLHAIVIPANHPGVDAGAVHVQQLRNLRWGEAIHAE